MKLQCSLPLHTRTSRHVGCRPMHYTGINQRDAYTYNTDMYVYNVCSMCRVVYAVSRLIQARIVYPCVCVCVCVCVLYLFVCAMRSSFLFFLFVSLWKTLCLFQYPLYIYIFFFLQRMCTRSFVLDECAYISAFIWEYREMKCLYW